MDFSGEKTSINGPMSLSDQFKEYLVEEDIYIKGNPLYFVYLDEQGCAICLKDEIKNLKNSRKAVKDNAVIIYKTVGESKLIGLQDYNIKYFNEKSDLFNNIPVLNPITFVIDQYGFVNHYKYLDPTIDSVYSYNKNYYKFINNYIGK